MKAIESLRAFFGQEGEVAAVYLYGTYSSDQSWPDTDIEVALVFPEPIDEDAIGTYLERLSDENPLGGHPGMLMPFALNTHILPVIYEILQGGTLLVENDAAVREVFVRRAEERIAEEREALVEQAKEAVLQARNLGFGLMASNGYMLPQPPRYLDPIRIGWRLARILGAVAMLDQTTRDPERPARDTERLGQVVGWFSNAAGAATGIAKAMLNMFQVPRPPRRWEVFLPLADAHLMTTELALQLAAAVELRWSLLTGGGLVAPSGSRAASGRRWPRSSPSPVSPPGTANCPAARASLGCTEEGRVDEITVQVQPTPNVNALKFVLNRRLTEGRSRTFRAAAEAADMPVARQLLEIPGVVQVFVLNDFITVTRDPAADWDAIVSPAEAIIKTALA